MSKKKSYKINWEDNIMLTGELLELLEKVMPKLIQEGIVNKERARRIYVATRVNWQNLDAMGKTGYDKLKQEYHEKYPPLSQQAKMKM